MPSSNVLQRFVGKFSALMNPLTLIIINMAIVVILYVGGHQVDDGILTQGQVIALVNYMSQILVELVKLANLIISVTKAVACGNRIQQILEVEPSRRMDSWRMVHSIQMMTISYSTMYPCAIAVPRSRPWKILPCM